MALLEHYNIRTLDLKATIRFYEDIIGLKTGPFPGSPGRGAWLYDESDTPVVHVVSYEGDHPKSLGFARDRMAKLSPGVEMEYRGTGTIDHIAFRCDDYDGLVERLDAVGLPYVASDFPNFPLRQIFVNDPSGVTCELNFQKPGFEGVGTV